MFLNLCVNSIVRQYTAGFICSISVISIAAFVGWTAPAIPKLRNGEAHVQMNDNEITWMVAILYLANMGSPLPVGWLMDRIGRKSTMLYMNAFAIMSWITLFFGTKPYHLCIGRFLAGLMFGAVYTVVPMYLAEIAEKRIRGALGSFISVMFYVGALFEYIIGPYVSYDSLILVSVAIPLLFAVTFFFIPESPYYLMMKGKTLSAERSLKWLRCGKSNDEISNELENIKLLTEKQMKESGKWKDLIKTKSNRRALIIAEGLVVLQRMSGMGPLIAYSSVIIPNDAVPGLTRNELMIILGSIWLGSSIVSIYLIEKLGRKALLIISSTGCGISSLVVSAWFYFHERTEVDVSKLQWLPYVALICHALFYSLGLGPVATSIKGEIFPANVKGKASAFTTINLALVAFILNKLFLLIADEFGMFMNFLVFGVTCSIGVLFVTFFVIETKGKTFHEIQEELQGNLKSKSLTSEPIERQ